MKAPPKKQPPPPPPTFDEKVIDTLLPWRVEIVGVGFILVAGVIVLVLLSPVDSRPGWAKLLWGVLGWGNFPLCFSLAALGLHLTLRRVERPYYILPTQVIGFELMLFAALPLSHQLGGTTLAEAYLGQGGGLVGWGLAAPLIDFFGPFLTGLFYLLLFATGLALLLQMGWADGLNLLRAVSAWLQEWAQRVGPETAVSPTLPAPPQPATPVPVEETNPEEEEEEEQSDKPKLRRRDKRLPDINLLEETHTIALTADEIEDKKQIIERTLADFGIPARVTQIRRGPAVTQFGVLPGYIEKPTSAGEIKQQKVRINQIASLQRDLALALAAPRLRIEAPVPGRGVVGIEVPNSEIAIVRLRAIIESDTFYKLNTPLAVGLGRDVSGTAVAVDLAKMPHLLVAGTTGSGKSVCLNALITNLVFNNPPEKLKLIMIDPKKVELIRFNGLPHLVGKVEVDADRAVGVLRWLTAEMDRRYEVFSQTGARNLAGYNRKIAKDKKAQEIPHIVVFIDELADLMYMYPGDVERTLCRLAQMARATGIHLVVATQRPSTDVITGLIKANFPSRISFSVASGVDSRVILDSVGAEQLLGKGDMLFLAADASGPVRVQGVFLNDHEMENVVSHWQKTIPDFKPGPPPWETLIAKHALLDETDTLLEAAIEIAQKNDNISSSLLQRRLRIGYPRAARIMEHLYEMGLVEDPQTGGKTRRSFVDREAPDPLERILNDLDREEKGKHTA